jgi:signal transduction histidine kinase
MGVEHLADCTDAILRGTWEMMFLLTRDGRYLDYHAENFRLLYAAPSEFLGKHIRDVMPPDLSRLFMDAIERALTSNEPVLVDYELDLETRRSFQTRLVRAGDDRVLSIVRDVSESKHAKELSYLLARRLVAKQDNERTELARELHDNVGQQLALLNLEIERIAQAVSAQPELGSVLDELAAKSTAIATALRQLAHTLHPSTLDMLGPGPAVHALCRDVARHAKIDISFTSEHIPDRIDSRVAMNVYRIVQEALHNVVKHSRAGRAEVKLRSDAQTLFLEVADTGIGFDDAAVREGIGLASMRERARALNGALYVHTAKGSGTRITVRIPVVGRGRH